MAAGKSKTGAKDQIRSESNQMWETFKEGGSAAWLSITFSGPRRGSHQRQLPPSDTDGLLSVGSGRFAH